MFYEFWHLGSGNIINTYNTEAEALSVVRGLLEVNTSSMADELSLGCNEDDGSFRIVAEGRPLAVMADRAAGEQAHTPARPTSKSEPRTRI